MVGKVVRSAAGRDRNSLMVIVGEAADHLLVCDGGKRRLERPKRKNPKHLLLTEHCIEPQQLETNRRLKKALKAIENCGFKEEK